MATTPLGGRPRRRRKQLDLAAHRDRVEHVVAASAYGRHDRPDGRTDEPRPGATVSGSVSVAATASDNVAVVGVQFKIDGGNLGAEDTTAPYSVSWPPATSQTGRTTVTAVARTSRPATPPGDQRTVTVSNTSSPPPPTETRHAPTVGLPALPQGRRYPGR